MTITFVILGITIVLFIWGSLGAPDYTAHADDDGLVDECDLLAVIENWGPAGDGR